MPERRRAGWDPPRHYRRWPTRPRSWSQIKPDHRMGLVFAETSTGRHGIKPTGGRGRHDPWSTLLALARAQRCHRIPGLAFTSAGSRASGEHDTPVVALEQRDCSSFSGLICWLIHCLFRCPQYRARWQARAGGRADSNWAVEGMAFHQNNQEASAASSYGLPGFDATDDRLAQQQSHMDKAADEDL